MSEWNQRIGKLKAARATLIRFRFTQLFGRALTLAPGDPFQAILDS